MIKLLSTDFDGTLVDHYGTPPVAPALFEALAALQRRGVSWAVNTGRELAHIEEGCAEFQFPVEPDFVLTSEREVFHRGRMADGRILATGTGAATRRTTSFFRSPGRCSTMCAISRARSGGAPDL